MDTAIVEFRNENTGFKEEIEIPLFITANDLIYALNSAYDLKISNGESGEHYLCSENPIAFLRGNKKLEEYGLRNGTIIVFKRRY